MKSSQNIQTVVRGFSNHYRVDVMRLLDRNPNLTVDTIAELLDVNYKTISSHIQKLHRSGIVSKKYYRASVLHKLTPRGRMIVRFLLVLE